jgi:hypothetical protein
MGGGRGRVFFTLFSLVISNKVIIFASEGLLTFDFRL